MKTQDQSSSTVLLKWHPPVGGWRTCPGKVHDFTEQNLSVRLNERLLVGQTIFVFWNQEQHRTTVEDCRPEPPGFLAVLRFQAAERRREERLATGGQGTLLWNDRSGDRSSNVMVRNATQNGIQVEIAEPLLVLQPVRLLGSTWQCAGFVRHCRLEGDRFIVGIEFSEPPSPKSEHAR